MSERPSEPVPARPELVGRCFVCHRTVMSNMPRLSIVGGVLHRGCAVQLHEKLGSVLGGVG